MKPRNETLISTFSPKITPVNLKRTFNCLQYKFMLQGLIFHYKDLTRLSRAVHLCKGDYLYILLLQDLGQLYPGFYIIRELFCHLLQVLLQLQIYHYFSIIFLKQQTFRPTFQKSIIGLNLAMLATTKKDPILSPPF